MRGKDIKRYSYEWADKWVLFIPWHFPNTQNTKSMEENEKDLSRFYPNLYKHLLEHKDKLSKRNKDETGIRYEWYCLQRWGSNYWNEFTRQKIVYPNMASEFVSYLDKNGFLVNQKCFIITNSYAENEIQYLCGFLNSKLNFWYFKQIGATLGATGYEMSKIFVEKIPVLKIESKNQDLSDEIIAIVDKIAKLKDKKIDTRDLESKIDHLIYRLYGLTLEEIGIIESA